MILLELPPPLKASIWWVFVIFASHGRTWISLLSLLSWLSGFLATQAASFRAERSAPPGCRVLGDVSPLLSLSPASHALTCSQSPVPKFFQPSSALKLLAGSSWLLQIPVLVLSFPSAFKLFDAFVSSFRGIQQSLPWWRGEGRGACLVLWWGRGGRHALLTCSSGNWKSLLICDFSYSSFLSLPAFQYLLSVSVTHVHGFVVSEKSCKLLLAPDSSPYMTALWKKKKMKAIVQHVNWVRCSAVNFVSMTAWRKPPLPFRQKRISWLLSTDQFHFSHE